MRNMDIEMKPRVELGAFVEWLAETRGLDYSEVESSLPDYVFEDTVICHNSPNLDWCPEVCTHMRERGIMCMEIYQDV